MKKHKYLILTLLWMGVIFFFSSQNGEESSMNNMFIVDMLKSIGIDLSKLLPWLDINFVIRKLAHLTEYFILGVLLYKTYRCYLYNRIEVLSIITGFLYACTDEFHQYFIPGRGPAFKDVLIDTTGVVLGVVLVSFVYYRVKVRSSITI